VTRLLVSGASGYLGAHAARLAAARGWAVTGTFHTRPTNLPGSTARPLDLTDRAAVHMAVADTRPDAILHTACSNRDAENVAAIVPAARHLAEAAQAAGARLVHVSTDLVFDGEHAPYEDHSAPCPIMDYGRAKAEAEVVVAALCPGAAVVRPSLIWALDPLNKQTGWLVEGVKRGSRVTLFTDEIRCPVHLDDLTRLLLALAERREVTGPLNAGGPQPLNRWAFGLRLLAALGMGRGRNVVPGTVGESGLARARDLTLRSLRAQALSRLRGVDDVLAGTAQRERRPRFCEG
jgi:dTDP-4-dehydrorhamnose reductase